MTEYLTTIGLEIHAELKTNTKIFCDCKNDPDERHPNINVCPICMGHPGTLPVLNQEAIRKMILVGTALNCTINKSTFFERKNYFYPDLPKGYQISQFQKPLCSDGWLEIETEGNPDAKGSGLRLKRRRKIRVERVHLEEDAGRLSHFGGQDHSLADYNRAGLPLMELVTKPDLETAEDVRAFATELRLLLRYLGASDADMEKGQMRVEVNISIRPKGSDILGTKVEVKNINSISAAAKSVEYEIERQTNALENGEKLVQETRGWDDVKQTTISQRIKEGSADYRYFPEPDLPPLELTDEFINDAKSGLPELPWQKRERFAKEYNLTEKEIDIYVNSKGLAGYFENVVSEIIGFDKLGHLERPGKEHTAKLIKLASNYCLTELSRMASAVEAEPQDTRITPEMFADLIVRIHQGQISSSGAQTVLKEMFQTGKSPEDVIKEKDLAQVSDSGELDAMVRKVIEDNAKVVADYKGGKEAALKALIGRVMAASKGKANPQVAEQMLKEKLK